MNYIDENGNRYVLAQEPGYLVWYVVQVYGRKTSRFKEITGSKDKEKASGRLNAYALKHNWLPYPDVICSTCAQLAGKTWPEGHIATFYQAQCDVCKEVVTCTEPRDWGHFTTVEELQALYKVARGNPCKSCKDRCTEINTPDAKPWLAKRKRCAKGGD